MNEAYPHEPALATLADDSRPVVAEFSTGHAVEIEQRVAALEKTVGELKNSPELEERITTRVLERLPAAPNGPRWYNRMNPFRGASVPMPSGWVFVDLFNEIRFVLSMLLDRRYAMTWTSRGIALGSIAIAFTASFWMSPIGLIPLVGGWLVSFLDVLVILLCGGLLFKILHREAERYRKYLENIAS